jgi:hypothetical protein
MTESFNDYMKIINSSRNNNQTKNKTVQYHNSYSNQHKDVNSEMSRNILSGINSQSQNNSDVLLNKSNI